MDMAVVRVRGLSDSGFHSRMFQVTPTPNQYYVILNQMRAGASQITRGKKINSLRVPSLPIRTRSGPTSL